VTRSAQERGLLVIADAKRGDIDVSAAAYAQAIVGATSTPWGDVEGLGADAMTVSPYLGPDTIEPFAAAARARGRGLFVLVRTSNPGGAHLQDEPLASGGPLWARVAAMVAGAGAGAGLSDVGAVTGATVPEQLAGLREAMPAAPFLLPGIGAQGGRVEDVAPAFAPGRAGGLITASRGIVRAHEATGGDPAQAARAEAERYLDASPFAIARTKRLTYAAMAADVRAHVAETGRLLQECFTSEDHAEGVKAFLERRPAVFTGR